MERRQRGGQRSFGAGRRLRGRNNLFAENPDLFGAVHLDGHVVEVGDDVLEVLGGDLGQVDVDPLLTEFAYNVQREEDDKAPEVQPANRGLRHISNPDSFFRIN